MPIASINPATSEILQEFEPLCESALDEKLNRAAAAFLQWRRVSFGERAALLQNAAQKTCSQSAPRIKSHQQSAGGGKR